MEIRFQTKERSEKQQGKEFLVLSGLDRFFRFLEMSRAINRIIPVKDRISFEERNKGIFLLIHKDLEEGEVGGNISIKFIPYD